MSSFTLTQGCCCTERQTDTEIQEQFRNLRLWEIPQQSILIILLTSKCTITHGLETDPSLEPPHAIWKCFYSSFGLHFHDHNLTSKNSIGCQILERRIFSASSSVALLKLRIWGEAGWLCGRCTQREWWGHEMQHCLFVPINLTVASSKRHRCCSHESFKAIAPTFGAECQIELQSQPTPRHPTLKGNESSQLWESLLQLQTFGNQAPVHSSNPHMYTCYYCAAISLWFSPTFLGRVDY